MRQPDGTITGLSQSIDSWSFGCVLSVHATWIVLGFQGIRQYERLRQLSPTNNKDGITSDRFHDGYEVLPEVEKWHNYLRGHLRPSDTTTEMVLDLIESKLLRRDPLGRHILEELCKKLQGLSEWAEVKIETLRKYSRDTDPLVMSALSNIEKEAQVQRSSERKTGFPEPPLAQVNPRERVSMQANKGEMIKNKPLGQTAHRRQILDDKLQDCYGIQVDEESQLSDDEHNGGFTASPTDFAPLEEPSFGGRKIKPRNPQYQTSDQIHSKRDPQIPNNLLYSTAKPPETPPSSSNRAKIISGHDVELYGEDPFTTNTHTSSFEVGSRTSTNSERLNLQIPTPDSPSTKYFANLALSHDDWASSSPPLHKEVVLTQANFSPTNLGVAEEVVHFEKSPQHTPSPHVITQAADKEVSPLDSYSQYRHAHREMNTGVSDTSPLGSPFGKRPKNERIEGSFTASGQSQGSERPRPSRTVSHPGVDQSPYGKAQTSFAGPKSEFTPTSPNLTSHSLLPLPLYALDLPFDICLRRKQFDKQVPKGFVKGLAKAKGSFGIGTRPRDASLVETFSDPRELVCCSKSFGDSANR